MPWSLFDSSAARRITAIAFLTLLTTSAAYAQELMPASASAWTGFSPRPQSAPGLLASAEGAGYTLQIDGNGVASVYGGWRTRIQGLSGNQHYRFRSRVVATDVPSAREMVTILLHWRGSFGEIVAPDYVWDYRVQTDGSLLFERILQAPPGTSAVDVELVLQWAPGGRVRFDALSFAVSAPPAPRPVRAAAVHYRPQGTTSGLQSVQRAAAHGQQVAAAQQPDVMVFGELLNVIGASGTFDDKAETIPGPSTDVMANLARTYRTYVAFGLLEREGHLLYNSAVLLDRSGNLAGKYRKMQLPLSEVSSGVTPGNSVPVFQTDFGRVALLICQDTAFPEPVREAAIQGAELLLVPIWGGKASVMTTRAIEQSLYVVASGYDYLTEVLDPLGRVVDRVGTLWEPGVAVAAIDLGQRFREDWSGDWRDVSNKQRRRIPLPYTANETTPDAGATPPPANVPPTATITSPASGASFTAPATISLSASASDTDGILSRVDFYAGTTLLGSDGTAPFAFTWSDVPSGSYTLTARAIDDDGASGTSAAVTVTVTTAPPPDPALPAPWQTQDIGAVGTAGSASASSGTFTVEGAGADIWATADAFRFVYQPISGDADVIARVASMEYVHDWVKGGVMVRDRLTPDSAHALMLVSPGVKGLAFQRRTMAGGASASTSGGAGPPPAWVKLERRGNTITAYRSADGIDWTLVGSDTFSMGQNVYVGLAVSSHVPAELATVTFDNIAVTAGSGLPPPWQSQDLGAVGTAGSAAAAGGTFTVRGSGADVWGYADAFHYVWQPLNGDADVIARVASVEFVANWVKAGVMVRERLTADSPHAFMIVSAGKGLAFQRRVANDGITTSTSGIAGVAPKWVRLERRGNVISAYWSDDGVTWNFVANDTFTMPAQVYVGLAVSSHDSTRLATVTFNNVVVR
jgi:predicted amidohydrolase/regulation of enolase protein 1 (concanavalin A-like superfamily)